MFIDIATPLAKMGIPVIPVEPYEKRCLLPEWQKKATTDLQQIERWNTDNPRYNVGCVGKPNGVVILDCDVKGLKKQIEEETRQKFPRTLIVKSAGKGATAAVPIPSKFWVKAAPVGRGIAANAR